MDQGAAVVQAIPRAEGNFFTRLHPQRPGNMGRVRAGQGVAVLFLCIDRGGNEKTGHIASSFHHYTFTDILPQGAMRGNEAAGNWYKTLDKLQKQAYPII